MLLFMLGSTLSISISPVLASTDLDIDNCPRLQEDYFGEIDGCPSRNLNWVDSDSDSIPDNIDQCILSQETFNGFEDTDGCPDDISTELILDHDSDSIPDMQDNCPLVPETFNDFKDTDGCPEFDNDKDGIFDSIGPLTIFSRLHHFFFSTPG